MFKAARAWCASRCIGRSGLAWVPADDTWTGSPWASICLRTRNSAIGERQRFARQTSRIEKSVLTEGDFPRFRGMVGRAVVARAGASSTRQFCQLTSSRSIRLPRAGPRVTRAGGSLRLNQGHAGRGPGWDDTAATASRIPRRVTEGPAQAPGLQKGPWLHPLSLAGMPNCPPTSGSVLQTRPPVPPREVRPTLTIATSERNCQNVMSPSG
jgi:hypothetical protein